MAIETRIQRRSMFWFVARTAWTVGRFLLTPKTGKLIFTKCFPVGGKATIAPIPLRTNHVEVVLNLAKKYNVGSALQAVRVGLGSLSALLYGGLWGAFIFIVDMTYLYGRVVYDQALALVFNLYKTGFEYLTTYVGQLTDQFLMAYTLVFGGIVAYFAYKVLRYVYEVLYNIYAVLCLGRKSVDDFTAQLALREEENRTYFADNFNHQLQMTPLASRVVTETTKEGYVLVKPLYDAEGNIINLHVDTAKPTTKKR